MRDPAVPPSLVYASQSPIGAHDGGQWSFSGVFVTCVGPAPAVGPIV